MNYIENHTSCLYFVLYPANLFYSDYKTLEDGTERKPWISLSGDDDGKHYVMYPISEDKDNWEYDLQMIIDTGTLHNDSSTKFFLYILMLLYSNPFVYITKYFAHF